ncbi:hypothetical protein P4G95_22410 [Burkholderia vietnamiensis]|nr:hypothetical protein [Burkholderia vietnamiensis]WHU94120.1 hypothetical protein P4G95_22410 [Burkholderia vietnamiensis]
MSRIRRGPSNRFDGGRSAIHEAGAGRPTRQSVARRAYIAKSPGTPRTIRDARDNIFFLSSKFLFVIIQSIPRAIKPLRENQKKMTCTHRIIRNKVPKNSACTMRARHIVA